MNVVSLFENKIQAVSKELMNKEHLSDYKIDESTVFFINYSQNTFFGEKLIVIFFF